MPSQIDPTFPVTGTPTTESVRANFATAQAEISALMLATNGSPFLPLAGGTVSGALYMTQDPTDPRQVATKAYVDAGAPGGGGGIPEAPADSTLYGRENGAWVQAASPADITAAIGAALVAASETTAGIIEIATQAEVNAGTDNTAAVTSLKLTTLLSHDLLGYVPVAGNSTITGDLILAPTGTAAPATLTLNKPDANGVSAVIGQQAGSQQWQLTLGGTNQNFWVSRSIGPSPGQTLTIEQATGAIDFNPLPGTGVGGISIMSDGGGGPTIIAGAQTAMNAASDYLILAARRSGSTRDSALIILRGPSSTSNPNGLEIAVGTNAGGYLETTFASSGLVTFPANIQVTGQMTAQATALTGSGAAALNVTAGGITVAGNSTFAAQVNCAALAITGSGSEVLNVSAGGAAIAGTLYCPLYANNTGTGAANLQMAGAAAGTYVDFFYPGGNQVSYQINGGASRSICTAYNAWFTSVESGVAGSPTGWAFYVNNDPSGGGATNFVSYSDVVSDARVKTAIADSEIDALALLRKIPLRRFEYRPGVLPSPERYGERHPEAHPVELGWIAQEVEAAIPEAVIRFDWAARREDDDPMPGDPLYVRSPALVPYLLRAVQQLAERIDQLEAGHA